MSDDLNLVVTCVRDNRLYKYAVKVAHGLNRGFRFDQETGEVIETLEKLLPPHLRDIGPIVEIEDVTDVVTL